MVSSTYKQVRQEWLPEELIESWTLLKADWGLVGNKTGATRLGFSLLRKFYAIEDRFPSYAEEVPTAAVDYMAGLVKVEPEAFAKYSWTDRQVKRHRKQIRDAFGTRPPTEADEEKWATWLAGEVCPVETSRDRLAEALLPQQQC